MKTIGLAILGLIAGLVIGMALTEVLASYALNEDASGVESMPLAVLIGLTPPTLGIAGAIAGPLIHQRLRQRSR
jgi:hypothetical protein